MSRTATTLDDFLGFSAELTGFSPFRLTGTGLAPAYLDTVVHVVGSPLLARLLEAYHRLPDDDAAARNAALRADILADECLGPVARNIIKLWYVGIWYQLPMTWRDSFGIREADSTFVVSPVAYTEGLLWPAAGASPPGSKGPGYGTWALPPRLPVDEG